MLPDIFRQRPDSPWTFVYVSLLLSLLAYGCGEKQVADHRESAKANSVRTASDLDAKDSGEVIGEESSSEGISDQSAADQDLDPNTCSVIRIGFQKARVRFQKALVPFQGSCTSETQTRECTASGWADWSGTYEAESCEEAAPKPCDSVVEHLTEEFRVRFGADLVESLADCRSELQKRQCFNGEWQAWGGTFSHAACAVRPRRSCGSDSHGSEQSRLRFQTSEVAHGSTCTSETQTRLCDDGTWQPWSGSFTHASCNVQPPPVTDAPCGDVPHDTTETRERFLAGEVNFGQQCQKETQTRLCDNGNFTDWSGTFTHENCQIDDPLACGNTPHGDDTTRTRFLMASVAYDATCQSETQTARCHNGSLGVWSGTYEHEACRPVAPRSCGGTDHDGAEERTRYQASSVPYGQTCRSEIQSRTCTDGTFADWSGTYDHESCTVQGPASCGATPHGQQASRVRYRDDEVPFGSTCQSEQQNALCTNGSLGPWSGTFAHIRCQARPGATCDGLPHGYIDRRTRFREPTVDHGNSCLSEEQTRRCNNGQWTNWDGNYREDDCQVLPAVVSLCTRDDLALMRFSSNNFKLVCDIDFEYREFPEIIAFSGTLDGQGHHLAHFFSRTSLFDRNMSGTVRNLTISGYGEDALIARQMGPNSLVEDVTVIGTSARAAVAATMQDSIVRRVKISIHGAQGGVVGGGSGTISDAIVYGEVSVGGIVDGLTGDIERARSYARVRRTRIESIGGIAGFIEGTIRDSAATGDINCEPECYISSQFWEGELTGGIVGLMGGSNSRIERSYYRGDIKYVRHSSGGMIGKASPGVVVEDSYVHTSLDCFNHNTSHLGAMIGEIASGTIRNSYYMVDLIDRTDQCRFRERFGVDDTSQISTSGLYHFVTLDQIQRDHSFPSGVGRDDLKQESYFPSFDFQNKWTLGTDGFPTLRGIPDGPNPKQDDSTPIYRDLLNDRLTWLIDDSDVDFSVTGSWARDGFTILGEKSHRIHYTRGTHHHTSAGGGREAEWEFKGLIPGRYRIYVRWHEGSSLATNATYTIWEGTSEKHRIEKNLRLDPCQGGCGDLDHTSLGDLTITSDTIRIKLSNQADGKVVADSVYINLLIDGD